MAQLAIKGHPTRGKEVIEILEMLGGKNKQEVGAIRETCVYFIDGDTISLLKINQLIPEQFIVFTLEEFLEKFPYKVWDKVLIDNEICTITRAIWDISRVLYKVNNNDYDIFVVEQLQPYKEETMEEIKIDIPKGYEFAGVDDDKQQVVFTKIQPQYPKTYEECAKELGYNQVMPTDHILGYMGTLLSFFQQLLICRDAYWQIAGEELGLGKPWEPDWENTETDKYVIEIVKNTITIHDYPWNEANHLLAFPTKEMRDAFYENFKGLINETKELL